MTSLNKPNLEHLLTNQKQAGIVMLVTLIALVIMLLASIALIRSTDTNLLVSGHLSFKRDIVNQAERTVPIIKKLFSSTGALSTATARESDVVGSNYFATIQASNTFGIPNALLGNTSSILTSGAAPITDSASRTQIYYMIDRMCLVAGPANPTACSTSTAAPGGSCVKGPQCPDPIETPIYRISVRAVGPRNTEVYIQSTFTLQ